MRTDDAILAAYIKLSDYLIYDTFTEYEIVLQAMIGKREVTKDFLIKHGNPILEKLSIEHWITDEYSNFDNLSMGYSRDSARQRLEMIQKKYGCKYGNMPEKVTDRINKKIEKLFK